MSDLTPQSETPTPTTDKITQAARETLYLCNFRVSVDGDWLCLRELNDISLTPDPEPAHEGNVIGLDQCPRRIAGTVGSLSGRGDTQGPRMLGVSCGDNPWWWWRCGPSLSCVMISCRGGGLMSERDAAACK